MPNEETIQALARAVYAKNNSKPMINKLISEYRKRLMAEQNAELDRLVLIALEENSIADVARAYTVSGKTPNRNAIHAIKAKYLQREPKPPVEEAPFQWVSRTIHTVSGMEQVFDVVAELDSFGPADISGSFRWRYDSGVLEPVITEDDPYPVTEYYKFVLRDWFDQNPYPGKEG